ncbi:MAG: M3 family metallopeptidase [Gammaproteobacteria bacterium]|nr:M3 family metallopeptidase [Gammaproteobacteria bacterium]
MNLRTVLSGLCITALAACVYTSDSSAPSKETSSQMSTAKSQSAMLASNPFFMPYDTPFGIPPFDKINAEHYLPAVKQAIAMQEKAIDAIVANRAAPDFANTIEALEYSGEILNKVTNVFYGLNGADTNDEMQEIAKQMGPLLSRHGDNIALNSGLFKRVKALYEQRDNLGLTAEQHRLLTENYKGFERGGANLSDPDKATLRKLNEELTSLSIQFGQNVLKEDNGFELVLTSRDELAGLPDSIIAGGASTAKQRGHDGKWVYTLKRPSMEPFLQYSEHRPLREKIYTGYINRGNNDNEFDNKAILAKMASLRAQRAALMGYPSHAHFVLSDNMAGTPERVYELINQLWPASLDRAREEVADMQAIVDAEDGGFTIEAWDWRFYAEKVRKAKYAFDEDQVRPYFELENVVNGVFTLCNKLFGMTFTERTDLPKYHEEVRTYEVHDKDGSLMGIYMTDWHPRPGKRGGAWMSSFRKQSRKNGENIIPVIYNVGNFSRPSENQPALMRFDEANTLFHEFGHALHGLLSDSTYSSLSGTSVSRDFVEFPSQVMENWVSEPEVLAFYAKHYETGEVIPQQLVQKIQDASKFNQGFATTEYLAAALLDLDWHTLTDDSIRDTAEFEQAALAKMGLIDEIDPRYRSTYFQHIFAGGYSAGYYSYIWSEVLDADTYQYFKESGDIFNPKIAQKYRDVILSKGGTRDEMEMYIDFRGRPPEVAPLIERRGLN